MEDLTTSCSTNVSFIPRLPLLPPPSLAGESLGMKLYLCHVTKHIQLAVVNVTTQLCDNHSVSLCILAYIYCIPCGKVVQCKVVLDVGVRKGFCIECTITGMTTNLSA